MTLAELSKKYGVHPTQIGTWKRAAIENMASAFTRRGAVAEQVSTAEVDKLYSKIGQLVVERDFLAPSRQHPVDAPARQWMPRSNCSEREAKNGEQGSQAEPASAVCVADFGAVQSVL